MLFSQSPCRSYSIRNASREKAALKGTNKRQTGLLGMWRLEGSRSAGEDIAQNDRARLRIGEQRVVVGDVPFGMPTRRQVLSWLRGATVKY